MKKLFHKKLIRDKIPDIIKANKGDFETRILDESEFEKELRKKLLEEAKELAITSEDELINELADVLEIIKSIASHHKIQFGQVEKYQVEKRKKRGGFNKRIFLIWSTDKARS